MAPPAAPLRIHPSPSGLLAALLFILHGGTLLLALSLPLPWYAGLAFATMLSASLLYQATTRIWPLLPWAIREALWLPDDSWRLSLANGRELEARLLPSSYVGVHLMVLNLRVAPLWHLSLTLLPDSLDPDLARRLRANLRQRSAAPDASRGFR